MLERWCVQNYSHDSPQFFQLLSTLEFVGDWFWFFLFVGFIRYLTWLSQTKQTNKSPLVVIVWGIQNISPINKWMKTSISYLKIVAYFLLKKGFKLRGGISYGIVPIPLKSIFHYQELCTLYLQCFAANWSTAVYIKTLLLSRPKGQNTWSKNAI